MTKKTLILVPDDLITAPIESATFVIASPQALIDRLLGEVILECGFVLEPFYDQKMIREMIEGELLSTYLRNTYDGLTVPNRRGMDIDFLNELYAAIHGGES